MKVNVKRLHPDAVIPQYATALASGFDLVAVEDYLVHAGETVKVSTGLAFQVPKGFELQVRPRSGVSANTALRICNSPGTVDADYTGEVKVLIENTIPLTILRQDFYLYDLKGVRHLVSDMHPNYTYLIRKGDRIAQGVICPVEQAELVEVDELEETERGSGGFGSTGVKG